MNIKKSDLNRIICIGSAVFLALYVFCAHFAYPFTSTLFLYIGVLFGAIALFSKRKVQYTRGLAFYILIIAVTVFGSLYSVLPDEAERQVFFFLIYGLIYWLSIQKNSFAEIMKKTLLFFAIVGMISVFIQFMIPTAFNIFLMKLLNAKAYENIMWSFNVDGSYTGMTSSVSMASFSMAIVFFCCVEKLLEKIFNVRKVTDIASRSKKDIFFMILILAGILISLFGIVLTNKRGIFIATVFALLLTFFLHKDISIKKMSKKQFTIFLLGIVFVIAVVIYLVGSNENLIFFLERFSGDDITSGRDVFYINAIDDFSNGNVFNLIFGKGTASAYIINDTGLHNVYLQILYDHGLVGIFIYAGFFVYNLKRAIKNRYFYSMSLQIVFLIYCMSGNPLYDYYFFIPYLIYSCYKG